MRTLGPVMALAALTMILPAQPGLTQPSEDLKALRQDIETLKQGQTTIQKDLQEIKSLLRDRPTAAAPAQELVVNVDGAPFRGKQDARVTIVEFTDYQ